jgi:hypothetical protein
MKRFSEQFNKKSLTVKLRSAEREALKERLVSYMEYHPMPITTKVKMSPAAVDSVAGVSFFKLPSNFLIKSAAICAAVVLVAVPAVAEYSVPGDDLYAIKVKFNEELRGTLAFSPYQKIEWETERLNRRVAEARLLASEGKLTDAVGAEIAAAVKEHTESVQNEIAVLREEDADEAALASIELVTTLEVQSAALQEHGTLAVAVIEDVESPAKQVADVLTESLTLQQSEVDTQELPSFDKVMARLEQQTTRAYEIKQSLNLGEEAQLDRDIERRLEDVGRSVTAAQATREGDEAVALQTLIQALERTQKLIVYMNDVDGNGAIALETVVPIILTETEQAEKLALLTSDIDRKTDILTAVLPQLTPAAAEKVSYAVETARATTVEDTQATGTSLNHAESKVAVLDDAFKIVAAEGIDVTKAIPEPLEIDATPASTTEEIATTSPEVVE